MLMYPTRGRKKRLHFHNSLLMLFVKAFQILKEACLQCWCFKPKARELVLQSQILLLVRNIEMPG